jgi:hypothetical protein
VDNWQELAGEPVLVESQWSPIGKVGDVKTSKITWKKHPVFQMKFIPSCWIKNIPYISFFCEMKIHPIDIWKFCKIIHMNSIP